MKNDHGMAFVIDVTYSKLWPVDHQLRLAGAVRRGNRMCVRVCTSSWSW